MNYSSLAKINSFFSCFFMSLLHALSAQGDYKGFLVFFHWSVSNWSGYPVISQSIVDSVNIAINVTIVGFFHWVFEIYTRKSITHSLSLAGAPLVQLTILLPACNSPNSKSLVERLCPLFGESLVYLFVTFFIPHVYIVHFSMLKTHEETRQ